MLALIKTISPVCLTIQCISQSLTFSEVINLCTEFAIVTTQRLNISKILTHSEFSLITTITLVS
jgi:hypothetical protein